MLFTAVTVSVWARPLFVRPRGLKSCIAKKHQKSRCVLPVTRDSPEQVEMAGCESRVTPPGGVNKIFKQASFGDGGLILGQDITSCCDLGSAVAAPARFLGGISSHNLGQLSRRKLVEPLDRTSVWRIGPIRVIGLLRLATLPIARNLGCDLSALLVTAYVPGQMSRCLRVSDRSTREDSRRRARCFGRSA